MGFSAFDRAPMVPSVVGLVIVLGLTGVCLSAGGANTKILLIGKERDHGPKTHEYMAWCRLLAKCLRQTPGVAAVVSKGWPGDPDAFKGVDAVVLYGKHGGNVLFDPPRREQAQRLFEKGVGLTAIHWSTGAEGDEVGRLYLRTLGGWFHNSFSVLKTTTLKIRQADRGHPICRGWRDYDLRDEYYLKLRFAPDIKPIMTVRVDGKDYPVGWAYERPGANGGRSFGCVLGHFHEQFSLEPFRRGLVNGILWTARCEVPEAGAPCKISPKDMELGEKGSGYFSAKSSLTPFPKLAKEVRNKGWIMYGVTTMRGDMDLYMMRPDGSDQRRVTNTPKLHEGAPRFSPDGRKVLYRQVSTKTKLHHNDWGRQGKIVIANADGSNPVAIGEDGQYPWASWSPDGKQISILSRKGVQIVDLATKKVVRTLPRKGMYQQLFWSPDGKWFCGVTNALGESWTVARMNAETGEINGVRKASDVTEETADPLPSVGWMGAECTPDWFPDSKHILFSHRPRARQGRSWTQLWMADGEGKHPRMVYAEAGRHIYGGTLSPDGKYVLFSRVWLDGAGGLLTGTHMGLTRFEKVPTIGGKNRQLLRSTYPNAKEVPVLVLPLGWEPAWTYADIGPKP